MYPNYNKKRKKNKNKTLENALIVLLRAKLEYKL